MDVSVVVPTYNRVSHLRQAVASCFAGNEAIAIEVIVVDDGSTDATRDYLASHDGSPRVRYFLQEHAGPQHARNRGLATAQGDYVKFLDDDDWLLPGALATEVDVLRRSGADLCHGTCEIINVGGERRLFAKWLHPEPPADWMSALIEETVIYRPPCLLYRRELAQSCTWDSVLTWRQDYAYALATALAEPTVVRAGRLVGCIREHEGARVGRLEDPLERLMRQADLLRATVRELEARGLMVERRRQAALRKAWRLAHMMAAYDLAAFREVYALVERLDASFRPARRARPLAWMDRLVGTRRTEQALRPLRQLKRVLRP